MPKKSESQFDQIAYQNNFKAKTYKKIEVNIRRDDTELLEWLTNKASCSSFNKTIISILREQMNKEKQG